ncbi:YlbF family regulator [Virgibacillus oceani]|uniref:Regulatory protein YlbF n=1 Tax=Virgibacillus oceani TaxID=1479511 RepID=A0A917H7G2_9BACI|nr:YlbF family regulator [Virgibacillus oceani]GGG69951.1 regulatory protein YlbF [Virgibacillus oceani]
MIASMEYVEILDHSEELGKMILHSDVMESYENSRKALQEDKKAQQLIKAFIDIKDQYEDVQRFGRYHPDYNQIMKAVRSTKREMDMNDKVAAFKIAERNLQKLLDEISQLVAISASEQIKAPKDGAALSDGGCGCGSGSGGCGCQAS